MVRRIDYAAVAPEALRAVYGLEQYVRASGLDHTLLHLVKLRASYLNGCAYCVDMHSKDARAAGETEQRIYALALWQETSFYSERERAALAFTEAVTRLGPDGITDAVFAAARTHFSEAELVSLVMAIVAINTWNRLAITFGADVGGYQPPAAQILAVPSLGG